MSAASVPKKPPACSTSTTSLRARSGPTTGGWSSRSSSAKRTPRESFGRRPSTRAPRTRSWCSTRSATVSWLPSRARSRPWSATARCCGRRARWMPGNAPPRALAHVPLHAGRQSRGGPFFRQSRRARPDVFARLRRPLVHAFPECVPGLDVARRCGSASRRDANLSLAADDRDPAAHWAIGRACWLRGTHSEAVAELRLAIELSPNFAAGHYSLAFVEAQAGDPHAAIASADQSRLLSPYDPLLFGMLGARAIALVRLGQFEDAADWARKAAARPNAHPHIHAIAAFVLALSGSLDEACGFAAGIRANRPSYGFADFLRAFSFDAEGVALFRRGAERLGMA